MRLARFLWMAIGFAWCCLPACAQGGVSPRHMAFNGYPSMPIVSNDEAEKLIDKIRDPIPTSTGHLYYNTRSGNKEGFETQKTTAAWLDRTLTWFSNGVDKGAQGLSDLTQRGTDRLNAAITMLEDIQAQPLVPVETSENFMRALEAYKLYRKMELMSRSWTGSLFKLDLLDLLPVWEQATTDQFGVATQGIKVGLTYKDSASSGDILSKAGMDNPFIGDWGSPKFKYQGPHKLSDVGLNIEPSSYMTSNQKALISFDKDMSEVMNRTFFEGIMGRSQAMNGLVYTAPEDGRPSPKLLKLKAQKYAEMRAEQIDQEIKEAGRTFKGDPQKIAQVTQGLMAELQYWLDRPDGIEASQVKRIERLRNEVIAANNVTIQRESSSAKSNDALPDSGNGFLDGVYNTYQTIGSAYGELVNNADPNDPKIDGGDSGPQIEFKARIQYAKSTHGAFAEAQAIRKLIYNKLKADCQQRMADGFTTMKRQVARFEQRTLRVELDLKNYEAKSQDLIQKLNSMGLTPESFAAAARAQ